MLRCCLALGPLLLAPGIYGSSGTCPAASFDNGEDLVMLLQRQERRHRRRMELVGGNVLFMVKSYSGFYETKLRAVLDTWGSLVDKSSLLVLGDKEWPEYPVRVASHCGSDATLGLSCRVAFGMAEAARTPGNWSWLFVVDDDHYVRPAWVERALMADDGKAKRMASGCFGCGAPQYCSGRGGFCGGCGYAFSRAAVTTMVGEDRDEFMAYHSKISNSSQADGREDMAISCVLQARTPGLVIEQLPGLDGAHPPLEDLRSKADQFRENLSWHSLSAEEIREMHRIFGAKQLGEA